MSPQVTTCHAVSEAISATRNMRADSGLQCSWLRTSGVFRNIAFWKPDTSFRQQTNMNEAMTKDKTWAKVSNREQCTKHEQSHAQRRNASNKQIRAKLWAKDKTWAKGSIHEHRTKHEQSHAQRRKHEQRTQTITNFTTSNLDFGTIYFEANSGLQCSWLHTSGIFRNIAFWLAGRTYDAADGMLQMILGFSLGR